MIIERIMADAAVRLEALVDEIAQDAIAALYRTGFPTEEEIETFTKWHTELLRDANVEYLKKLRAFLERDGEPLQ